jgi:radical SAM superfamily enzyme YgiQ (UPF0313 family)
MKLLIVQPSHYPSKHDRRLVKAKRRTIIPLALPYLAALTPRDWDVALIDEQLTDIDFAMPVDLVAITVWSLQSLRAYEIADEFRSRGVKVILGGPHVFFHPEEALLHADAIGLGEAEPIWADMLADAAAGRLQKRYVATPLDELKDLPFPRLELLDQRHYKGPFRTLTVQSSRGCPFPCSFCSERLYLGGNFRWRPAEQVVQEIRRSGLKNVFFAESNFGANRPRALELMEALIPLGIRWSTLWSSHLGLDNDFLKLAKRSGVLHVNIGIESIDAQTLAGMNKKTNKASRFADMCANLRRHGISYSLNFIFGWDGQAQDVYRSTLDFLNQQKVPVAYFNIFNPAKGTDVYDQLLSEGRIVDPHEIDRWPVKRSHVAPAYCSSEELERKVWQMYREFYSLPSMLKRLPLPTSLADVASWFMNMKERRMVLSTTGSIDFQSL